MTVAFFYREPVALDRVLHQQWRLLPVTQARFAAASAAVPLLWTEFAEAGLEYPIVFIKSDTGWTALAVTGLADGENLFVDAQGRWTGRYVPLSVRRYPFVLSQRDGDQLGVCIDKGCEQLLTADPAGGPGAPAPAGERLFDDAGEPSPWMRGVIDMLFDFQGKAQATSAFVERLVQAQLLVESQLEVSLPDGRKGNLSGAWIVNEAALKTLPDSTALAWFRSGELALVHSHLISLRNLGPLLLRRPV
jgi:hypothetical protein